MGKMKIAFDLDGVIADKPPLVPKELLEWFFKGHNSSALSYRFPRYRLEQLIRKLSHFYLLRPPIKENLALIKEMACQKKYELFIVSGRYSFLESETYLWLKKRGLDKTFKKVYLNLQDEPPHLFKEKVLKDLKPDFFIDDDAALIAYLKSKLKKTKILDYSHQKKFSLGIDFK